jgi:two-component system cell cycle response regulator DivK
MATVSPRPRRSTVLLVESDQDNRDMYAECLRTCGFAVLTANTTDEGLRCASDADVVVTEIRVSGSFDGVDLVSRLRHADATKRKPIIVLTACTFELDRQRAYAAGCDVFLSKPCMPEELMSAISGIVATHG